MKRIFALTLLCTLSLGCQSGSGGSEADPQGSARNAPLSFKKLYETGVGKLVTSVKALPQPLKELRIAPPSNRTRNMMDMRELEDELTGQLSKVEGLVVVERDDAPWLVTSTVSSEEIETAEGRTITTTLQLQLVNSRGILASAEAVQVDRRDPR